MAEFKSLIVNGSTHVGGDIIGHLKGNADTATKLAVKRNIKLSGDVSGTAAFDGTADASINATVNAMGSVKPLPYWSYDTLNKEFGTTGSDTVTYFKSFIKKIMKSYSSVDGGTTFIGSANPNTQGTVIFRAYDLNNWNNTGLPRHCRGTYFDYNGGTRYFGTVEGVWYWYNADEANKLKNARTINGVAFDGTKNITIADSTKIPTSEKGKANGVATLDSGGKIPSSQLPSYVDDIVEVANLDTLKKMTD